MYLSSSYSDINDNSYWQERALRAERVNKILMKYFKKFKKEHKKVSAMLTTKKRGDGPSPSPQPQHITLSLPHIRYRR